MSFDSLRKRLLSVEKRRSTRDVLLTFRDGTQRAVRMHDPLSTLLQSWRNTSRELGGLQPEPSQHDRALALFANASGVEGDNICQLILDSEHERKETQ